MSRRVYYDLVRWNGPINEPAANSPDDIKAFHGIAALLRWGIFATVMFGLGWSLGVFLLWAETLPQVQAMTQTQARQKMETICGDFRGYAWELPRFEKTATGGKKTVVRRFLGCMGTALGIGPNASDELYGGPVAFAYADGSWEKAFEDLKRRHPAMVIP